MLRYYILFTLTCFSTPESSAAPASLCGIGEVTYFSCAIENSKKIASLCGGKFKGPPKYELYKSAWLQYRFGTSMNIELKFPNQKINSLKKFEGDFLESRHGQYYSLSFVNHGFRYTLNISESRNPSYGVFVFPSLRTIEGMRYFQCKEKPKLDALPYDNDFRHLVRELDPPDE